MPERLIASVAKQFSSKLSIIRNLTSSSRSVKKQAVSMARVSMPSLHWRLLLAADEVP